MTIRTGIDMLELRRMEASLARPGFAERWFGPLEIEQYRARGEQASFLAGNFCVKEAFSKCLGTGIRNFALQEVQVLRNQLGMPYLQLSGAAKSIADELGLSFSVSISNTSDHVVAVAVAYSQDG